MPVPQERRFVDTDADEMGHFGELRSRQPDGEAANDVVRRGGIGVDGQQAGGFEVDEHVPVVFVDADLGQGDAGSTDRPSADREFFDWYVTGHRPAALSSRPRRGERCGGGEMDLHSAVRRAPNDDDARLALSQLGSRGPQGDVDTKEALSGVEPAQHPFHLHRVRIGKRDPGRRFGSAQLGPPARRQQGDDAGGDQGGLADPDR